MGWGNIGKSFALQVANDTYDSYILELSSFQLDGIGLQTTHCYNNKYKSGSFRSLRVNIKIISMQNLGSQ
jgi:UDP-N-acetylmuramoylalanine-D-glutamate ligase